MILLDLSYWGSVWQNSIGCTFGSFAAIAVAFVIYKLTNVDNEKQRREMEVVNQTNDLQYFSNLIRNILRTVGQQQEAMTLFVQAISEDETNIPLLRYLPLYDLNRISQTDSLHRYFLAYAGGYPQNAVNVFGEIVANVDYLNTELIYLPEMIKRAVDFDHERKIQYRELFSNCYRLIGKFMVQQDPAELPPFAEGMNNILNVFWEGHTDTTDIKYYHVRFFVPVHKLVFDDMMGDPSDAYSDLTTMALNGLQLFNEIKKANQEFAEQVGEVIKSVSDGLESLERNTTVLLQAHR